MPRQEVPVQQGGACSAMIQTAQKSAGMAPVRCLTGHARCAIMQRISARKEVSTVIETERLLLREMTDGDFDALHEIFSDSETMQHYPAPFDAERTRRWIAWNQDNYQRSGFGLWAVVLKESGELIGDCGITMQNIDGEMLPEIGYHIHKKFWRKGSARKRRVPFATGPLRTPATMCCIPI